MRIKDIIARKGSAVTTASPDDPLESAIALMRTGRIGALVVMAGDRLAGLISEKDIVRALSDCGPRALRMPVAEFMEGRPVILAPDEKVARAARTMTERRARHAPVMEGGRLAGVISVGDIVKDRLEELELEQGLLRDMALSHRLAEEPAG